VRSTASIAMSEVARGGPAYGHARPTSWELARKLLGFAFPTTLIMLLSGTSLVVDTYFVTGLGTSALAGASLVLPMYLLLVMAFGGGIGVGISVVLSVRLGRGDERAAQRAVGSSFALALGLAVAIAAGFALGGRSLLARAAGPGPVLEAAVSFARPLFLGAPIIASCLTISNILRSEKRLREAAVMLLVSSIVNAALNPILIHGYFGAPVMGVAGAGLATVLGFLVSALLGVHYLRSDRGRLRLGAAVLRIDGDDVRAIGRIALPTLASYAATSGSLIAVSVIWARFGTDALAAFGLLSRLEYVVTIVIYGIGSAILTLGGEALGAGEHRELRRICWIAAATVAVSSSLLAVALMSSPAAWFRMFGASHSVVSSGARYMLVSAPAFPVYFIALTLNYGYQTVARAHLPFFWALLRGFVVAVPFVLLVLAFHGSDSVAAAGVAASKVLQGLLAAAYLPRTLSRVRLESSISKSAE